MSVSLSSLSDVSKREYSDIGDRGSILQDLEDVINTMVKVKIMRIHDFMSVKQGFSMLLFVKIVAQDFLPVGFASCTSFKFIQVCFFITKHYAGTHFLCFEQRFEFFVRCSSPDSYTIGKIAFKQSVIHIFVK